MVTYSKICQGPDDIPRLQNVILEQYIDHQVKKRTMLSPGWVISIENLGAVVVVIRCLRHVAMQISRSRRLNAASAADLCQRSIVYPAAQLGLDHDGGDSIRKRVEKS